MPHALIVDDNPMNIKVMTRLLKEANITCTAIQDSSQAYDIARSLSQLDIVFLDLDMPHYNGFQVFEILYHELGLTVPIVACTVYTNEMATAKEAGFHSFIGYPLKVDAFIDQVKRILNDEPIWDRG